MLLIKINIKMKRCFFNVYTYTQMYRKASRKRESKKRKFSICWGICIKSLSTIFLQGEKREKEEM